MGDVIDDDVLITHGDEPIVVYKMLAKSEYGYLKKIITDTEQRSSFRVGGVPTVATVYGALPRSASRTDFCRYSRQTHEEKHLLPLTMKFKDTMCGYYERYLPEIYQEHVKMVRDTVNQDWLLYGSPFTTCNFNINFAIPYHYDKGNMAGVFSNVFIMSDGISGGELVCPEFGVTFKQRSGALIIFKGYDVLHGVMPITKMKSSAYRCSVVYYTLKGMCNCLSKTSELQRSAESRTGKHRVPNEIRKAKVLEMNKRLLTTKK